MVGVWPGIGDTPRTTGLGVEAEQLERLLGSSAQPRFRSGCRFMLGAGALRVLTGGLVVCCTGPAAALMHAMPATPPERGRAGAKCHLFGARMHALSVLTRAAPLPTDSCSCCARFAPPRRTTVTKALAEFRRTHEEAGLAEVKERLTPEHWEAIRDVASPATYFV
jgi:hypothetical protein